MRRVVILSVVLLLLLVCTRNRAPWVPTVTGPSVGEAGDTLEFEVSSRDPEGDAISFSMDWGEGGYLDWGPFIPSGRAHRVSHVFGVEGAVRLRARARDGAHAESGWSEDHQLVLTMPELERPEVWYYCFAWGSALWLEWQPVPEADGYEVVVDGDTALVRDSDYAVWGSAARVSVAARKGPVRGDAWRLDCRAVVTTEVVVYGLSDPDPEHPSGFGFDGSSGECIEYTLAPANHPALDFVMDDSNREGMSFRSPSEFDPQYNSKSNSIVLSADDFDNSTRAKGEFSYSLECEAGRTYYLWIDPSEAGWDPDDDHFAKAYVQSVEGAKVTMKVAYQRIAGLTWLVTDRPDPGRRSTSGLSSADSGERSAVRKVIIQR